MFKLTDREIYFIGFFLEGFFYGLYSGIFAMYLRYQALKKDTEKAQNIVFYSICSLYVLSVAVFISDIASAICQLLGKPPGSVLPIYFIQTISFGCCDFIAQFILIYRCWIVWGCDITVVIVPSILAFAFLALWLATCGSTYIFSDQLLIAVWVHPVLRVTSLALSLTVNALVTGLIAFRIFRVFQKVKVTSGDKNLGATGGSKLRSIMFIIIESGMALFSIQLSRLVVTIVMQTGAATIRVFNIVASIHEILNGITPTIILVRTSMGLSFYNEKSMEEVAIGSLHFASNHPDSTPETGSISIVGQEGRGDDDIDVAER